MKHVVRYLLEGDGSVPLFIKDGGHFPLGEELVGISVDDAERYLPASVQKLSRAQLVARLVSLGVEESSAAAQVDNFLAQKEMSDYE